MIRRGAFAKASAPVPVFWQHDARRRVGTVEMLGEDARGLRVIGCVDAPVAPGTGLSFGYRVNKASLGTASGKNAYREGTNRQLIDLELVEVSLVTRPMQPLARVHAVEDD